MLGVILKLITPSPKLNFNKEHHFCVLNYGFRIVCEIDLYIHEEKVRVCSDPGIKPLAIRCDPSDFSLTYLLQIGALMALEFINRNSSILPDYEIIIIVQDTQCKSDVVMKQFLHFLVNTTHPVSAILGKT